MQLTRRLLTRCVLGPGSGRRRHVTCDVSSVMDRAQLLLPSSIQSLYHSLFHFHSNSSRSCLLLSTSLFPLSSLSSKRQALKKIPSSIFHSNRGWRISFLFISISIFHWTLSAGLTARHPVSVMSPCREFDRPISRHPDFAAVSSMIRGSSSVFL